MKRRRRPAADIARQLKTLLEHNDRLENERLNLLEELQVNQQELTAQNEELMYAQSALEETRDRFIDLFDFAPNGYVILDANGIVREANLTAAALLGRKRENLEGMPLLGFARPDDRSQLLDFLRRCRTTTTSEMTTTLALRTSDGQRDIQLVCKPRGQGNAQRLFTSLIDVTEHRLLERERETAAREHAALASQLISVQDEERHRIARDLHDNIGQQVTALRLLVDSIGAVAIDATVRNRIARAQKIVMELDKQLDFLTSDLRPVALDLGAVKAIEQFVGEWSATFGIEAQFKCQGLEQLRLNPNVETHLYRIVQEALNNAAKHAGARRVLVQFDRYDPLLVLRIVDDGVGFDVQQRVRARTNGRSDGLGLVGMRERAQIINGTLDVRSAPGRGTTIVVRIPAASALAHTGQSRAG